MGVCNNKMKILLLLLVLVIPLFLKVSADEDCYYFDFDGCSGINPSDTTSFRIAYLENNNGKYLSSYAKGDKKCIKSKEIMRILEPCLCRENYNETHFYFVPVHDKYFTFDGYFVFCVIDSTTMPLWMVFTEPFLAKHKIVDLPIVSDGYKSLMNETIKYAEDKCPIFNGAEECPDVKRLQNDEPFTFAALINNAISFSSTSIIKTAVHCDTSFLKRCLCRLSHDELRFLFLHDNNNDYDYPAMCIVGNEANEINQFGTDREIYDFLMNETIKYQYPNGKEDCPILRRANGCFNIDSLQNETFTFAALKNNTVSISSTSIKNETDRCDMSILLPCLCRSSLDEPLYFILPDYETLDDYPVMCIVGNAANEKYQFGSKLEIYDLLMSKKNDQMPSSLINPFIVNDIMSSCTDIYGNPTKNVRGQNTCMISVDFSRESDIDFIYAGPLLGSSMLDFSEREGFMKSDIIKSCRSTAKLPEFDSINKYWIDWCFLKNTFDEAKVQCCCVKNPSLCSPRMLTANESKKMLCLSSNYGQMDFKEEKTAVDFLQLFSACSVSLKFESHDANTNFQFQYGHSETCDSNMKSKVTVEDPAIFCSSNLAIFKNLTVIKCCTDGHFCNRKLVPEFDETTWCSRQNRMEQIAMGTSNLTCTHFYDLGVRNFTKILIGFNAEIPDGQPQIINQTSLKNNTFEYDLNFVYAKIIKEDECPNQRYNKIDEHRPIIQVVCEERNCDEDIFETIPLTVPSFRCQSLSEPFVKGHKYEALMENSTGWICYVEIKNDHTIQAGELIDFTNHTDCLQTDVFQHHFCCSNVFAQENTSCTIEELIKRSPDIDTQDNPFEDSGNYCKFQSLQPYISCTKPECFVSRLPAQSDDDYQIEPAGCKENAEKYVINDEDNTQMASVSLACLSSDRNKCSLLKDVEGNERIVCCCDGKECDKMERNLPKEVGKLVSSFKSQ